MTFNRVGSEITLGILAIISVALILAESLFPVSQNALIGIYAADLVIVIIFGLDFARRYKASEDPHRFLRSNWYELVALTPAVLFYALGAVPVLAVFMRSLRLVRVIRVIMLVARMSRIFSRIGVFLQRSRIYTLLGITTTIVVLGAFSALLLDSGSENAKITNISDAIWWSISTITTVGYGDIVPSSFAARVMGMGLMIVGIGVMAAFVSQVSATLVESRINDSPQEDGLKSAIKSEIKAKIDNLENLSDTDMTLLVDLIQTIRTSKATESRPEAL